MKKFLKKAEGFTLVELIVVIAILGILTAVAVPAYTGYIEKANEAADTQTVAAILTSAQGAMAQKGTVEEVRVDLKNGDICAVFGNNVYILKGDAAILDVDDTAEKTVIASGTAGTGEVVDADLTGIQADFDTYFAGNTLKTAFEHKVLPSDSAVSTSKVVANYAVWKNNSWTFDAK